MEKDLKNRELRIRFNNFYVFTYNPNIKSVSKAIGIYHTDLYKWKNNRHEYSMRLLKEIESFLVSKGF